MKRRTTLRRKTRLRSASPRYARELRRYSGRRKAWLAEHPLCEIGPRLAANGIMVHCLEKSTQIHHLKSRGKHLNEEEFWMAGCSGECHGFIKQHQDIARRIGLLLT